MAVWGRIIQTMMRMFESRAFLAGVTPTTQGGALVASSSRTVIPFNAVRLWHGLWDALNHRSSPPRGGSRGGGWDAADRIRTRLQTDSRIDGRYFAKFSAELTLR
jgi:hypothetical protein